MNVGQIPIIGALGTVLVARGGDNSDGLLVCKEGN